MIMAVGDGSDLSYREGIPDGGEPEISPSDKGQNQPTNGEDERSVRDLVTEASTKRYMKFGIAIFVATGVGMLLALLLLDALASETFESDFFLGLGLFVGVMVTPVLSAVIGIVSGLEIDDNERAVAIAASLGSFIGFVVFLLLLAIGESVLLQEGQAVSHELFAYLLFGLGIAATGAIAGVVTKKRDDL